MSDYILDLKDNLNSIEFCLDKSTSNIIIKTSKLLAKLDILEEELINKANRYKSGLDLIQKSHIEHELSNKMKKGITNLLSCIYQIYKIENKIKDRECKVTNHVADFIHNV